MSESTRKQKACRYWLQGYCKHGGDCKFAHHPGERGVRAETRKNAKKTIEGKALPETKTKNTAKMNHGKHSAEQKQRKSRSSNQIHIPAVLSVDTIMKKKKVAFGRLDVLAIEKLALKSLKCVKGDTQRPMNPKKKDPNEQLFHLDERDVLISAVEEYLEKHRLLLLDLFAKGSQGADLFVEYIVPYLSVQGLLACARTGHTLHRLCRTFTLQEILEEKPQGLAKSHRIGLGRSVMQQVVRYGGPPRLRPTRVIVNSPTECFRAKLYHPNELPQIHSLVDSCLLRYGTEKVAKIFETEPPNQKKSTRALVSAFFGPIQYNRAAKGKPGLVVTDVVKELVMKHGDGHRLILQPPLQVRDGAGNARRNPITFRWWYTRFFGDPCPNVTKHLIIDTRDTETLKRKRFEFHENQLVDIELRVS